MIIRGVWAWLLAGVLLLSLGINFFLVGYFFERARVGFGGGPPAFARVLDEFPPQVRRSIGRELWQERRQFRATLDEIRTKRRAIAEAMRNPQVEPAEVRRLMGEVRQLTTQLQERAQDAMIEALARMTPEERAAIGEHRRRGGPPWRERGDGEQER